MSSESGGTSRGEASRTTVAWDGYDTIEVLRHGPIGLIQFNRPARLNAISEQLSNEVQDALGRLEEPEAGYRAVVLAGKGRAFCAGADIGEARAIEGVAAALIDLDRIRSIFSAVAAFPLPTVAAVHGLALGGGFELALACDFRVMDQDTQLGLPELKIGALPAGGGMSRLSEVVGVARTKQIVMGAQPIDVAEAYGFGLVNQVVRGGDVVEEALSFAEVFATKPATTLRLAKRAVEQAAATNGQASRELATLATAAAYGTADKVEGMRAFLEKDNPRFTGG